jgi:ketosteroid isomerase-like protein
VSEPNPHLDLVGRYLAALERGATGAALAEFFTPDVVQDEFPNRLTTKGVRRDLAGLLDAATRGRRVVTEQRFVLLHAVANGNDVALEVQWTATLAVKVGTIPPGGRMHCRMAIFLEIRDGKIARQRNYDCFDPW